MLDSRRHLRYTFKPLLDKECYLEGIRGIVQVGGQLTVSDVAFTQFVEEMPCAYELAVHVVIHGGRRQEVDEVRARGEERKYHRDGGRMQSQAPSRRLPLLEREVPRVRAQFLRHFPVQKCHSRW